MSWRINSEEPEDGQLCVVFDPTNENLKVWPAEYSRDKKCFFAGSRGLAGWFEYSEITHWMPLPAPPTN